MDPLVDETGQPYAYTGDDPVNLIDPTGQISAGTICGADGARSAACRGAIQISAQVGKEVAANQVSGGACIIDLAGAIGSFVASHKIGELEIAGAVLTVAAAIATGGTSLAIETTAEAAIEGTSEAAADAAGSGVLESAASSPSTVLNGISTGVNTVACLSGHGESAGVSCVAAGLGAAGVGLGLAAELSVAPAGLSQLNLMLAITSVVGLLPAWAVAINGG